MALPLLIVIATLAVLATAYYYYERASKATSSTASVRDHNSSIDSRPFRKNQSIRRSAGSARDPGANSTALTTEDDKRSPRRRHMASHLISLSDRSPHATGMSYSDFLKDHHISKKLGFVLENPVTGLDQSKFGEWTNVLNQLTTGSDVTALRRAVESIGDFDVAALTTHEELRYAKLLFELVVQGYLYLDINAYKGEDHSKVPDRLPASIARPLLKVSALLGMKPVICHGSVTLANVKLARGKEDAEFIAENLEVIAARPYLEGADKEGYDWFFKVTAEIEACFARAIYCIGEVCFGHRQGETNLEMEEALSAIIDNCARATLAIKKYRLRLTPRVFFYEVRPSLWGYDKIPNGLKFGPNEEGFKYRGASAAESSAIQVIDAFFDLKFTPAQRGFVLGIRDYMPAGHRKFIEYVEESVRAGSLSVLIHGHPLFPAAMAALRELRSAHINLVTLYVVTQMPRMPNLPVAPGKMLVGFMKSFRDACVVPPAKSE